MTRNTSVGRNPQAGSIVESLQNSEGLKIRSVFSSSQLTAAIEKTVPEYRNRGFPPDVTLFAFMHQTLSSDKSLRESVSRVNSDRISSGLKPLSLNTASFSDARKALPVELPRALMYSIASDLEKAARHDIGDTDATYKGKSVKLIDGSTLLMADTPANQSAYPQISSQKKGSGFPIARIAGVFSLFTGAIIDLAIAPYQGKETGEHALIRKLFHCFESGDIVLGDSYYSSYFLMAVLLSFGVDFVFETHGSRKSKDHNKKRLGKGEYLVEFQKPRQPEWMSDELYALIPEKLSLREIEVTIENPGFRSKRLAITTSLIDTKQHQKSEIGCLYACRWAIELNFRDIKTTMKMDFLRAKTPEMVVKEIWVHLLSYNAIRKIMVEAAIKRGVLPWQISFKATIQVFNQYSHLWYNKSLEKKLVYELILDAIGSQIVGNRPGRLEPRVRKRRPKPFRLLQGKRVTKKSMNKAARKNLAQYQNQANEIIVEGKTLVA